MLQRDKDGLPTGELVEPAKGAWDDAFTEVRGVPSIIYEDVLQIDIESDAPWWVVYTEDSEGICVEPQTAPPDAANLADKLNLNLGSSDSHYVEALFTFQSL
jgi:aldose 1-epimerase